MLGGLGQGKVKLRGLKLDIVERKGVIGSSWGRRAGNILSKTSPGNLVQKGLKVTENMERQGEWQ